MTELDRDFIVAEARLAFSPLDNLSLAERIEAINRIREELAKHDPPARFLADERG